MNFTNRICRMLHDEHQGTLALMERLQQLLTRHRPGSAPDAREPGVSRLLADLATTVETELGRHFAFEEDRLFTYLDSMGNQEIGVHLTGEHKIIQPIATEIAALARAAATSGFDEAKWNAFHRLGRDLCDRLLPHVEMEESALLPMLEDNMDADTEAQLYQDYAQNV
jgi:hemerythrin-like domain-containing protein